MMTRQRLYRVLGAVMNSWSIGPHKECNKAFKSVCKILLAKPKMPPGSTEPSDVLPILKNLNLKDDIRGPRTWRGLFLSFFWPRVIKQLLSPALFWVPKVQRGAGEKLVLPSRNLPSCKRRC